MKSNTVFWALALISLTGLWAWAGEVQNKGRTLPGSSSLQPPISPAAHGHLNPKVLCSGASPRRITKKIRRPAKKTKLQEILELSRSCRLSEGAPAIEVLWRAGRESDISIWADAIHARRAGRVEYKGTSALVLLGEEGSGVSRKTIYVYTGNDRSGWCLQLVCPTTTPFSKIQWKFDSKTGVLAFSSNDKAVASVFLDA